MEEYYERLNFEKKVIIWSLISRAGAIKMSEVWRGAGGGGHFLPPLSCTTPQF